MDDSYRHIQGSMLRYISDLATTYGVPAVNLDAVSDFKTLAPGDFVAMSDISLLNNGESWEVMSIVLSHATENDPSGMRLVERVSKLYDACKPRRVFTLYDIDTGVVKGDMVCVGDTRILPVDKDAFVNRVAQGVLVTVNIIIPEEIVA